MKWQIGVTTVAERFGILLPKTLESLEKAGFTDIRVFVDGEGHIPEYLSGYAITQRIPRIKTYGNWILALWEMYIREPQATLYAIFQDDCLASLNLRSYLEKCRYPEKGYWNLYTWPNNEGDKGWHLSDQAGRGAVGIVFDKPALQSVIGSRVMVDKPLNAKRGRKWKWVDGSLSAALASEGYKEYVHTPSLLFHTGEESVIGNSTHPLTKSFPGEDFDCLELLT